MRGGKTVLFLDEGTNSSKKKQRKIRYGRKRCTYLLLLLHEEIGVNRRGGSNTEKRDLGF